MAINIHDFREHIQRKEKLLRSLFENGIPFEARPEDQTKQEFIDPLLEVLGWNPNLDYIAEFRQDPTDTGYPKWRDYQCYLDPIFKSPCLAIEAKQLDRKWKNLPKGLSNLQQIQNADDGPEIIDMTIGRYGQGNPRPFYFLATNGSQYIFFPNPYYDNYGNYSDIPAYVFDGYEAILNDLIKFYSVLYLSFHQYGAGIYWLLYDPEKISDIVPLGSNFTEAVFGEYLRALSSLNVQKLYLSYRGLYQFSYDSDELPEPPRLLSFHYVNIRPDNPRLHIFERTFYLGKVDSKTSRECVQKKAGMFSRS